MMKGIHLRHLVLGAALFISLPVIGGFYKWVDHEGNVHFSDRPPDTAAGRELTEQTLPEHTAPEVRKKTVATPAGVFDERSAPADESPEPGVLPENSQSRYLKTESSGFLVQPKNRRVQYVLYLSARRGLPYGAVLDVEFAHPANKAEQLRATARRSGGSDTISVQSPYFSPLKCGNFLVKVSIYRNPSRSRLLGVHHQYVQSRIDMEQAPSLSKLVKAMLEGNCP